MHHKMPNAMPATIQSSPERILPFPPPAPLPSIHQGGEHPPQQKASRRTRQQDLCPYPACPLPAQTLPACHFQAFPVDRRGNLWSFAQAATMGRSQYLTR